MFNYTPKDNCLQHRTILVTGAGSGIGASAAKAYAKLGATVILLGRTTHKLETVYDEIVAAGSPEPALYPLNLLSATVDDYQTMAHTLTQNFGQLHGVLNNAAILGDRTPISQYDISTWENVMQINVNAAFMLTQALLPVLQEAADASVIFTSSSVGIKGSPYWGAYGVSKFATEGLAQTLAEELENISQVRVNTVDPGATRTQMYAKAYPGANPAKQPSSDDIMPVYTYLMSPDSLGITGQRFQAQAGQP